MAVGSTLNPARSIFISSHDGLRIHVRHFGASNAPGLPVVCLPGLTRTVADFESMGWTLANTRRAIAIDSRGRGQSDYDPNPENYNVAVELADVVTVLVTLQVGPAVFVGSSRGGILTMLLAASHPGAVAGAVLHDIGPVIEPQGIARIKSYVGKIPQPGSFAEGAEALRQLFQNQFPRLTSEQWLAAAQRTWAIKSGALVLTYDVRLAEVFDKAESARPPPALWKEFDALAGVPILVIRGVNSDILSAATVNAMRARHPSLEVIEVADQGHVPLLEGLELFNRITAFVERCEKARTP
jgi:pimeloyl-ACP methyl ester carboxylesterase